MRVRIFAALVAALAACVSVPAAAEELATKAFPAVLEPGLTEFEMRYGRLTGDTADGEDVLLFETAHHFSKRVYGGLELETERDPDGDREIEAFGAEGIVTLGTLAGINVAVLGEYSANRHDADAVGGRLILQKRSEDWDARLNFTAEKALRSGEPVEFGYVATIDHEIADEFRVGAMGVGELGTSKRLTTRGEHFLGPIARYEIEKMPAHGELEFEAGYLFALGEARRDTDGLLRFMVEYGVRF